MPSISIPRTSNDITSDWLNQALLPHLNGASIVDVQKQTIGEGVGMLGELNRLTLSYDRPEGLPATLISKLPSTNSDFHDLGIVLDVFERECHFYHALAPEVDINTPFVYFCDFDKESQNTLLLLEDISPSRPGDQVASCSLEDARLAVREIATLHARWWGQTDDKALAWVPSGPGQGFPSKFQVLVNKGWPALLKAQGVSYPAMNPELINICERVVGQFGEVVNHFDDMTHTLVHGDYRLDNMFFDATGDRPLVVIDWQVIDRAHGLLDVVYFLAGNLTVEDRRNFERTLLQTYHDTLLTRGVTDYDFSSCWRDYRRNALALPVFMMTGQDSMDFSKLNSRSQSLFRVLQERWGAAALDLDVAEFLH